MSDEQDGHLPVRSRLAIALLKGGLAFGAVWALALLAFVARVVIAVF